MIEFSHLYKSYDKKNHALKDITLKIESGDFVFLTGPSGAGKSTLFKMITAYDVPTSGRITVGNFNLLSYIGWLDDVAVFNRPLTGAEVRAIHELKEGIHGLPAAR